MVQKELFQLNAFGPAVGSEDLAHGAAFFQGLDGSRGGSQFAQDIMVKMAVSGLEWIAFCFFSLRQYLTADIINA